MIKKCVECGEVFDVYTANARDWAWKRGNAYYCSYTCMRTAERRDKVNRMLKLGKLNSADKLRILHWLVRKENVRTVSELARKYNITDVQTENLLKKNGYTVRDGEIVGWVE